MQLSLLATPTPFLRLFTSLSHTEHRTGALRNAHHPQMPLLPHPFGTITIRSTEKTQRRKATLTITNHLASDCPYLSYPQLPSTEPCTFHFCQAQGPPRTTSHSIPRLLNLWDKGFIPFQAHLEGTRERRGRKGERKWTRNPVSTWKQFPSPPSNHRYSCPPMPLLIP